MAIVVAMAAIFAGIWSAPDVVRARLPILAGMGINTSIALLLAGLALLLPRLRPWLGGLIAAISAAVLGQYFFAWMPADGFWRIALNIGGRGLPWPWHMSPLAAFSLLCAGLALATLDRPRKLPGQILSQAAPGFILAAVVGGALNRSLDGLLFVATLDRHAIMSLPTMMALCVWVSGYLAAMAETPWFRRFYAAREERQALAIGLIGFTAALLLGSAASVAVLGRQMQATVEEELSSSVRTQATIFPLVLSSALHSLHARTGGLASRADLPAALREMAGSNGSAWLAGSDGAARLRAGLSPADRRFRLRLDNTRSAWLAWNRGLMLEIHLPAAQGQGTIVVQEPLPELERLFTEALSDTQGGVETRLCGRAGSEHMVCLPSAFMPRPLLAPMRYKDQPVPMWHALQGQRGVAVAPDYRGVMVVAAYVPVAELGLGMVRKVDVENMYQPIRTAVWRAIAIMAGIGTIAALLIYLRVRFVVRRAVDTGRQLRGVLEALPVGVWLTDASGRFILNNPAGSRIWAGERWVGIERLDEYKGWWHDTGKRIEAHDWALAR
ncbi:MAG: hypothetical protein B7X94_00865, partial [Hydrogenophilales bacterium 17-62-8]